ncbi:MBL fold metallo-hydrolase [Tsukamurella sp. 8F]|uniref:MBL fold metallo-hydrolase n=1 Tax=unclassified Tsukamurella TaxID=2633480 RepID=UPI0023B99B42|nr:MULTISPECIES: MBL fold metallo-hydrolase [unclassified Tsukamurella]MDF0528379.1 MBL fold metallo-hydrolase [Tsukamurella sp. 8J]MDF0586204.1 MBL fold metallo-hydrolase [Tsukamurella sp. 8F]
MRVTHFHHSCVLVEAEGTTVLFDPGSFSHGFEGLTGLDAIVITHQHPDHVDVDRLPSLVEANPGATLLADPTTAAQLGGGWHAAAAGDTFTIGGLTARAVGGRHAIIHPDIPQIDNTSFLLGSGDRPARFYHPGDALFVPDVDVEVLGVPANAPWAKLSETVDFLRAVKPRRAVPIHDALLSDFGASIYLGQLGRLADPATEFLPFPDEVPVELD